MRELFINSLERWATNDLKTELRRLNLSTSGSKHTLVARLQQAYRRENFFPPSTDTDQLPNQSQTDHLPNQSQTTPLHAADGSLDGEGDNSGQQIGQTPARSLTGREHNSQMMMNYYTSPASQQAAAASLLQLSTSQQAPAASQQQPSASQQAGATSQQPTPTTNQYVPQQGAPLFATGNQLAAPIMHANPYASSTSAAQNVNNHVHFVDDYSEGIMGAPSIPVYSQNDMGGNVLYDTGGAIPRTPHVSRSDTGGGSNPLPPPPPPPSSIDRNSTPYPSSQFNTTGGRLSHAPLLPWLLDTSHTASQAQTAPTPSNYDGRPTQFGYDPHRSQVTHSMYGSATSNYPPYTDYNYDRATPAHDFGPSPQVGASYQGPPPSGTDHYNMSHYQAPAAYPIQPQSGYPPPSVATNQTSGMPVPHNPVMSNIPDGDFSAHQSRGITPNMQLSAPGNTNAMHSDSIQYGSLSRVTTPNMQWSAPGNRNAFPSDSNQYGSQSRVITPNMQFSAPGNTNASHSDSIQYGSQPRVATPSMQLPGPGNPNPIQHGSQSSVANPSIQVPGGNPNALHSYSAQASSQSRVASHASHSSAYGTTQSTQDNSAQGYPNQSVGITPNSQSQVFRSANHSRSNRLGGAAAPSTVGYSSQPPIHQNPGGTTPDLHMTDSLYPGPSHQFHDGPNLASTRLRSDDQSFGAQQSKLQALEMELKILRTQEQIRKSQFNLTLSPYEAHQLSTANQSDTNSSVLQLVKQSVDLNSLPPSKPCKFSGDIIEYPKWRTTFDLLIETKDLQPHQKLVYLEDYLSGEALDLVKGYSSLNTVDSYYAARKELDSVYGDPLDITEAYRDKLEGWKKLTSSDKKGLKKYSCFLNQCITTMNTIPELSKLSDPRDMKSFPNALPDHLLDKWSRFAGACKYNRQEHPSFKEYVEFVKKESFMANSTTTSRDAITKAAKNPSSSATKKKPANPKSSTTLTTKTVPTAQPVGKTAQPAKAKMFCHKCKLNDSHNTVDCRQLAKLSSEQQQEFIKSENLCFRCLRKGHGKTDCKVKIKCSKCSKDHPTALHDARKATAESSSTQANSTVPHSTDEATSFHTTARPNCGLTTMILPVYVSAQENPEQETLVYALVDNQSDTSFIDRNIAQCLDGKSTPALLKMSTMTTQNELVRCNKYQQLRVRGINSDEPIYIPATYTQNCIPGNRDHIPTPETARMWKHLKHLEKAISPLHSCEIAMLIGFNCPDASLPLSIVKGKTAQPHALKTVLGWSIVGGISDGMNSIQFSHRVSTQEISSDDILKCLSEDFTTEEGSPMSQNDIKFLKKMKEAIATTDGFYTMPLPFKDTPTLPDNRPYALKRFKSLERKLISNPELNTKYRDYMSDIISRNEAQVCTSSEQGWYIPHHGVFHPNKPGKLRVVFDCSSSYQGYSLNKQLLKGPDLNNNLAGLLCRFRKDKVAVTCDIQKMYHQFRVAEPDRRYIRFLWYKENTSEIIDHQMNVHLFGATSSPSCAIFGLKQLATDYSEQYPKAASFFHDNFYVDDGLISLSTPEEVTQLMSEAKSLAQKGNLTLHKFQSNDPDVAASLGGDGPTTKDFSATQDTSRALGLIWDIKEDSFKFSDKSTDLKPHTRRGILSTVAAVFDPLGFLAPFTLIGKLLIQDLCKDKLDWDDPLSEDQERRWNRWLVNLQELISFEMPRCFLSKDVNYQQYSTELHLFSDASTLAYGSCAYLRIIDSSSPLVTVSLVMTKSRVAPQKAVTIPRLELQAATLSVKLADFLSRELKYDNLKTFYWSDSEAVLGYIANEAKAFYTFVCNRIQRIKDSSQTEQWHYISTRENPADIVSRGATITQLQDLWLHGPKFLSDPSFSMDDQPKREFPLLTDDPEIRKVFTHTTVTEDVMDFISFFDKFSSWSKVIRILSHVLKLGSKHRKQGINPDGPHVFNSVLKLLQQAYLPEEMEKLQEGLRISRKSPLFTLDPFIDDEGILRVGGRLDDALTSYQVRHPAVMPGKAHLTKLFVAHKHAEVGHQGKLTTLNHIRSSGIYIYGQGTRVVSSMIYNSVSCIRLRGKPMTQKMSNLPAQRTEPTPPFTHVGMDVFGPFSCKDGRKENKRYGLIFTCLASRAVHLELLEDMTTDCFINSFRCFTAIRGPVKTLLSDRGTNFVGARNEFQKSLLDMMDKKAQRYLKSKQCEFKFNIPSASHMGGVWERLIRSVRDVLKGILLERNSSRLDTACLRTLLYECMSIVNLNCRLLTIQQLNQDSTVELLPLTPNTILTMKHDHPASPPGNNSTKATLVSKRNLYYHHTYCVLLSV